MQLLLLVVVGVEAPHPPPLRRAVTAIGAGASSAAPDMPRSRSLSPGRGYTWLAVAGGATSGGGAATAAAGTTASSGRRASVNHTWR